MIRERSYLEAVKSFPRNLNARVRLTFTPSDTLTLNGVPDSRFITVGVHYAFAELPERPMTPRHADDRVGYFITARKDMSQDDSTYFTRYVNRWRLEPGRRVGNLHEPVTPITYYLDRTIPEQYRPYVKAGVEAWNRAFEAAGFANAIRAELLPDSAAAEDLRYATIRWVTSDEPVYGAIGPSVTDPRTGEILDADILFEGSMVQRFKQFWRPLVRPAAAIDAVLEATPPGRGMETVSSRRSRSPPTEPCFEWCSRTGAASPRARHSPTNTSGRRSVGSSCTKSGTRSGSGTTSARRWKRRPRSWPIAHGRRPRACSARSWSTRA